MSTYHCPLCPLIFEYRTEVEWHLREEHRSRLDEDADLRAELAAASGPLDRERLQALRAGGGRPSVSLLLATAPAETMNVLDVARLRQLADRARRGLARERHSSTGVIEHRLARAVSVAESLPTDRGLAVLVNDRHLAIVALPFAPRDRHVVGAGFATRDLEYSLQHFPRYRVLVLGRRPRILEGTVAGLREVGGPGATGPEPGADDLLEQRARRAGPLPLVLVGDRRQLDHFARTSRHAGEVELTVARPLMHRATAAELAGRALSGLDHDRYERAVDALRQAERQQRVAWGLEAAWAAAHPGGADRIYVDRDYAVAGRVAPDTGRLEVTGGADEPRPVGDLVDELVARAAQAAIPVDILDGRALSGAEPVAAVLPVGAGLPDPAEALVLT